MKEIGELLEKSLVHLERREYRESAEFLDKIISLAPDFHRAWFLKGVILEEAGSRERAQECFRKGGNIYNMWFRLALQFQDADPQRVLPYYDRVLEGDRNHNLAWFNKGALYEKLKSPEEARKCYRNLSPGREILSRIIVPIGFMGFLIGGGITMLQRGERAMSALVFGAALFCLAWMKRDAGTAIRMYLKKKHSGEM